VAAAADPVAAVVAAHDAGARIALRTSGTTAGQPRSVVRTTTSWWDSFGHVSDLLGVDASSHVVVPGPLSATMNLFAAVHARRAGARLTLARLDTAAAPTHAVLTPAALARLLAGGEGVRGVHVLVAGDRLEPGLHARALAAGAARVSHYYGAAELSFVAWGGHAQDLWPFPGVEIDVRDGRVWVRSRYLFDGYDGEPGPARPDADGFVSVGDRGALLDGRLAVLGRDEGTVVTAGATVRVAEVEAVLGHELGAEVYVVGVPHPDLGEVLCGVVTRPRDTAELRASAARVLPDAQRPRRWYATDDLPLTVAGKLDRAALVRWATQRGATHGSA
jgi:long-chain acyl-CoA synthetase